MNGKKEIRPPIDAMRPPIDAAAHGVTASHSAPISQGIAPTQVNISVNEVKGDGSKISARVRMGTENIIATFAGLVAIIIVLGMVFGGVPLNELTIGVLSFSGVSAVIAKIIGTRRKK